VQQHEKKSVVLALSLVQLFFGLHYLAAKLVLLEIPPRAWAAARVASAAAILLAGALLFGRRLPRRAADWGALAVCSVFGIVVNQVCFLEGLSRTTAIHSALINTTIPVWTLVFAVLLGRERLDWRKLSSLAVALGGVILVLEPWAALRAMSAGQAATLTGDLLTVVSSSSYSFFLAISKKPLERHDPIGATAVILLVGAVGIGLFGGPQLARVDFSAVSARALWLGAFIVLFATVGAYVLNYYALSRAESSLVALFICVQPVIATVLGALVLRERPRAADFAGAALIFGGVYFAVRGARRATVAAPAAVGEP
jgi:drug/metabolite transporter (DMT)-like permease